MTNATSKHAWPSKQYDDNREGYEEYEVDKNAWLIDKGYDKHVCKTDPRTISRVTTSYEVTDPTDPNGKVGDWIESERGKIRGSSNEEQAQATRRLQEYNKTKSYKG